MTTIQPQGFLFRPGLSGLAAAGGDGLAGPKPAGPEAEFGQGDATSKGVAETMAGSPDQVELSVPTPPAPAFSKAEQDLLKSLKAGLTGGARSKFVKLLETRLGDRLLAFVDLQLPDYRDKVAWQPNSAAFDLAQQLEAGGHVGRCAEKLLAGIDPARLALHHPGPREVSDPEVAGLSALVGKRELRGSDLALLSQVMLKRHGHDFPGYVSSAWPEAKNQLDWSRCAATQAFDLLVHLRATGHDGPVAAKLLEDVLASRSPRDHGTA